MDPAGAPPNLAAVTTSGHTNVDEGPEPLATPGRVLAIGAHPDDIEFGCGATIARWAAAGSHVVMAVVTDGSKGSWDTDRDPLELAALRAEEAAAAAHRLGAFEVVHLGYVDGELEYSMELRGSLARLIRVHRPDVVLSHDPWQRYQMHPDHRTTGLGVVDAIVAARDPLFFPEHDVPHHRPATLLLWSADEPDHIEAADDVHLTAKVEALLCHRSQAETTMGNADKGEEERQTFAARVLAAAKRAGERFGAGSGEAFKLLKP
jgi:LmbE family N-acetylglucosaminyl deacetylase